MNESIDGSSPLRTIEKAIELLYQWVTNERYYGWDPYDGLYRKAARNTHQANNFLEIAVIQFNKLSPLNFRHLLKIEKGIDTKGVALFLTAYSKLYPITGDDRYLNEIKYLLHILERRTLKEKLGFDCWASHYFPYISTDKRNLLPNFPDIIGTATAIIALVNAYKILNEKRLKEMAISAGNFLIEGLLVEKNRKKFFKYYPAEKDRIVPNASALGLETLCNISNIYENEKIKKVCKEASDFLIKLQDNDGSWPYAIYIDGRIKIQHDFHQGFVIDGLMSYVQYSDEHRKRDLIEAIEKGAKFYKKLFFSDGRSYYRYPTKYPVDIHNQVQGIITFSKLYELFGDREYLNFARKIALWTIKNMQDKSGYFYYQKWPFFTNKIPYMRWSQAWMMLALSFLLSVQNHSIGGKPD